ncbi:unnamed protein product [Polarella glacialis]|uniref:Golgin-84 n=1 Tax=Polarella glacialis TaxID=89957 RepID=A0A813HB46_POLGL|nr:unnamed protein product [Polarella glacialis]CAE8705683.1 unnamed protein product [Polarella glacialis]
MAAGLAAGDSGSGDGLSTQELCAALQAKARSLEQRDFSQMRQGAILQRKLDAAELQRRELERQLEARRLDAARQLENQQQAQSSETAKRKGQAVKALQSDLQERWEEVNRREQEVERSLRAEQARQRRLQSDLSYWRRCGQELLRTGGLCGSPSSGSSGTAALGREKRLAQDTTKADRCQVLSAETEAVQRRCHELRAQISELERLAASARMQESELKMRNHSLATGASRAESAAASSRQQAERHLQEEQRLQSEVAAISAQQETRQRAALMPEEVEEARGSEEVEYWRRKVQEKAQELEALDRERARLRASLQRHAGPASSGFSASGRGPEKVGEALAARGCGLLDETVSWFTMGLFKSVLMRRAFCVHLALLYSWILFLLWWLSARTHD